jgi:hypothetical protein
VTNRARDLEMDFSGGTTSLGRRPRSQRIPPTTVLKLLEPRLSRSMSIPLVNKLPRFVPRGRRSLVGLEGR